MQFKKNMTSPTATKRIIKCIIITLKDIWLNFHLIHFFQIFK